MVFVAAVAILALAVLLSERGHLLSGLRDPAVSPVHETSPP